MTDTIRAFIAVELPPELKDSLGALQQSLKKRGVSAKWIRPASMHLTLKFLGNIDPGQVGAIAAAARRAAAESPPLSLAARGLGTFPNASRPRVIWVGLTGEAAHCTALARRLENELVPLGFETDGRPFRPHLTLGRFKGRVQRRALRQALERWADVEHGSLVARELVLCRSELLPEGARHTVLERVPLGSAS